MYSSTKIWLIGTFEFVWTLEYQLVHACLIFNVCCQLLLYLLCLSICLFISDCTSDNLYHWTDCSCCLNRKLDLSSAPWWVSLFHACRISWESFIISVLPGKVSCTLTFVVAHQYIDSTLFLQKVSLLCWSYPSSYSRTKSK